MIEQEPKPPIPAGASGLPCDENCEYRALAEWENHFVEQCKQHPWVIRKVCMETGLEETRTYSAKKNPSEVISP